MGFGGLIVAILFGMNGIGKFGFSGLVCLPRMDF